MWEGEKLKVRGEMRKGESERGQVREEGESGKVRGVRGQRGR